MTAAISTDNRLSSQVRIGSSGHDFDGVILIKVRISPYEAGSNEDKGGTSLSVITCSGAVAVLLISSSALLSTDNTMVVISPFLSLHTSRQQKIQVVS